VNRSSHEPDAVKLCVRCALENLPPSPVDGDGSDHALCAVHLAMSNARLAGAINAECRACGHVAAPGDGLCGHCRAAVVRAQAYCRQRAV